MEIRTATETDTPEIVNLLKLSLGEGLTPKSIHYWQWKHRLNPFGESPVLTCWEQGVLIGVRAFMRWEWTGNGKIYKALRAVDTATHPDHQGKGIFKKLTLALVDYCTQKGDDFVFNTPNNQSKPGYIKMGWREAGKLPIVFSLHKPVNVIKNIIGPRAKKDALPFARSIDYYLDHPQLHDLLDKHALGTLRTNVSIPYLKWRYRDVPVATYDAIGQEQSGQLTGLLLGRIKSSRLGNEFRVTDCFLKPNHDVGNLVKKFVEYKKTNAIDYCTISGLSDARQKGMAGKFHLKASFGPTVTIRSLSLADLGILQKFRQWSPSLGDLELF
jgi:GNAT superfamily N-acetyltransferase